MTVDAPPGTDIIRQGHVRLAWALRELADYAIGLVPRDAVIGPTEHVLTAERLRVLTTDVAMLSVMLDRARGAPWPLIARSRSISAAEAEHLYAPLYQRWVSGVAYPWHPPGVTNLPTACPDDIEAAADTLDGWYLEHCGPLGRSGFGARRTPVSCVLED